MRFIEFVTNLQQNTRGHW